MSGVKGMRHYPEEIVEKVKQLQRMGKTYQEISMLLGFKNTLLLKGLMKRKRRKLRQLQKGILPKRKGRPPLGEETLERKCQRLEKENEILKSFYQKVGRGRSTNLLSNNRRTSLWVSSTGMSISWD